MRSADARGRLIVLEGSLPPAHRKISLIEDRHADQLMRKRRQWRDQLAHELVDSRAAYAEVLSFRVA